MRFATGLSFPEGPVALLDGSWLCVESGAERGCITQISPDGRSLRVVAKTGRPNGLAVDKDGFIWAAESKTPSLLRVTLDGKVEIVATGCEGEPFLFPNDLCFGPDGAIYMTDSGVHIDRFAPGGRIRSDYLELSYDGRVYRVDPQTRGVRKLDAGLKFTNGIAFGPDGYLYVNETLTGMIFRYAWRDADHIGLREEFGNVNDPSGPPGWRGPDGMAFGMDGKLYVAVFNQRDVTVLGPDGAVVRRIPTQGRMPTNCAFGLPGRRRLYVTEFELGQIEMFDVETDGLPLYA
jgi:gluconolactonase